MIDIYNKSKNEMLPDIAAFAQKMSKLAETNKIFIYGAGIYGKLLGRFFNKIGLEWQGYIDKNEILYSKIVCGKKVYCIQKIPKKNTAVVVLSISPNIFFLEYNRIITDIVNFGFKRENIIAFNSDEKIDLMDNIVPFVENTKEYLDNNIKLKDIYYGKRCFIIGNGPSLTLRDLEMVNQDITMACNEAFKLYNNTTWRPTCFFGQDPNFLKKCIKSEEDLNYILDHCQYYFTMLPSDISEKYGLQFSKIHYLLEKRGKTGIEFIPDICGRIGAGASTLHLMLEVAVYMGIKEIYLLGVDFSFYTEIDSNGTVKTNEGIKNHMSMMDQSYDGRYYIGEMLEGYKNTLEYAKKHGIEIYNATRGGKLEIFPRVELDVLF